jgi:aldehyde:ferredoxin oxidoreductase
MGKLLFVDLSSGVCKEEELGEEFCHDFMCGYGIGAKILYERMKPRIDPLGPDNMLGFLTSPLTGTLRHLFSLREGLNLLKYFMNPIALGKPPLKEGSLANVTIDDDIMIKDYLKPMDWDLTTTEPSAKKLQELGLSQLVNAT